MWLLISCSHLLATVKGDLKIIMYSSLEPNKNFSEYSNSDWSCCPATGEVSTYNEHRNQKPIFLSRGTECLLDLNTCMPAPPLNSYSHMGQKSEFITLMLYLWF